MPIITTPSGTATPTEINVSVLEGGDFSANITPDSGKKIALFKQDGTVIPFAETGQTVEILDIQDNHLLEVFQIGTNAQNAFFVAEGSSTSPTIAQDVLTVEQNGLGTNSVKSTKTYETASIARAFCGENVNSIALNFGVANARITEKNITFDTDFTFNFKVFIASNNNLANTEFWLFANDLITPTTGIKLIKIPNASNSLIAYRLQFLINSIVLLENSTTILNGVVYGLTLQRTNEKTKFAINGIWGNSVDITNTFTMNGIFCFCENSTAINFGNYSISLKSIYDINTDFTFNSIVKNGIYLSYRDAANNGTNCIAAQELAYFDSELVDNLGYGIKRADGVTILGRQNSLGNWRISQNNFVSEITMIDTSGSGRLTCIMDTTGDIVFRTNDGNIFRASQNFAGFVKKVPSAVNTHNYVAIDYTTATATLQSAQVDYANYDKSLAPSLFKMVGDGVNDFITFAQAINAAMATVNAFTIEMDLLFKVAPTTTQFMPVFGNYNSNGANSSLTNALVWDNRSTLPIGLRGVRFDMTTSSNEYLIQAIANPSINTSYRFAACFASNQLQIYINGNRVVNQATTGNLNASNELFYIFRSGNFNPTTFNGIAFNGDAFNIGVHRVARYSGTTYDHTAAVIEDGDTLIYLPPIQKSDNVVDNLGIGGNGTLNGVTDYTLFYQTR